MRKRNKAKHLMNEDHNKGTITTKYDEYRHKDNRISELQCFSSSTKCQKTVSLKSSFGLSVEI